MEEPTKVTAPGLKGIILPKGQFIHILNITQHLVFRVKGYEPNSQNQKPPEKLPETGFAA